MKTIAIMIDDETMDLLEELQGSSDQFRSRSALVRAAIRDYAVRQQRRLEEEREREIIHQNKELLDKELSALVEQQAH